MNLFKIILNKIHSQRIFYIIITRIVGGIMTIVPYRTVKSIFFNYFVTNQRNNMQYKDTKLISFLQTFSKPEIIEFEKFLISPFFKTNRDLIPLLKALLKYYPEFSSINFTEDNIFTKLYPKLNFSDKKSKDIFRTLSSSLLKAIEEFLYFRNIKNNNVLRNRTLLKNLLDRNLYKYYPQYLQIAETELKSDENEFGTDFLEKFYLESLNVRQSSGILDFKKMFEHSSKAQNYLSAYYWIDLFRNAKIFYLGGINRNINYENNPVEKIMGILDLKEFLKIYEGTPQYIFIYFNFYTYMYLKDNTVSDYYNKAKKVFFENKNELSIYDKNIFYADLMNVIQSKIYKDNQADQKEIFFLMKSCLEDKAYKVSDNDFMQLDFYRNVIQCAMANKKFEWAKDFIDSYSDDLKPELRENMKYFSKAHVSYNFGNFEESLVNITKVKYDISQMKLDVKILMLKIFFDLNLKEQSYSLVDTFRHYLKKSKELRPEIKERYSNFLKYYLLIIKLKSDFKKTDAGLIKILIEKDNSLYLKKWLIEKLEGLNIHK